MSDNFEQNSQMFQTLSSSFAATQNRFINRVFGWMTVGLAVTGVAAWLVASNAAAMMKVMQMYWLLIILEFVVVVGLSGAIRKLSAAAATAGFLFFAALNGVTLSTIFLVYDANSITATFFATSGTFGIMGLIGWITKKDLTSMGSLCGMGLIGLVIASLICMFFPNGMAWLVISVIGVLIFVGLTAYDTQKIKQLSMAVAKGHVDEESGDKLAILGALQLYLDFINLFLMILRLFGNRK